MEQKVFNLIILDESGSMSSIERQAISGVNETIQSLRLAQKDYPEQTHFLTLVSFNSHSVKTIYDNVEVANVEELTDQQYCPAACTPLYDAMGLTLTSLSGKVSDNDAVIVTVITDGYENSSKEYDGKAIKALVDKLKKKGWLFTYIGANQDVEAFAHTISITNTLSFTADADGTHEMFARDIKARRRWVDRLSFGIAPNLMCDDYFDEDN